MLDMLFNFVFQLITKVADILISPLISGLVALFPTLSNYITNISNFIEYCLTYVRFIRDIFLIPVGALSLLIDYYLIKYSIYLFKVAFNFIIKIYNLLKP